MRWGTTDCHAVAFAALDALTGQDVGSFVVGTYSSASGAVRAHREHGDLCSWLDARDVPRVPADTRPTWGDIVHVRSARSRWRWRVPLVAFDRSRWLCLVDNWWAVAAVDYEQIDVIGAHRLCLPPR